MPSRKVRLTHAEQVKYFNAARKLREAGVDIKVGEDLLLGARAIDVYLAPPGGLGSVVTQSSNGAVHYAIWLRLVARHACKLLDFRVTTQWDRNILLNSYGDRTLCRLGKLDFPQADVLNQRIEESLEFRRRGDMVEGLILATGIRPIPQAFAQGMRVPFELAFDDQFDNETAVAGEVSVDRLARQKESAPRFGTGLYGASAASRKLMAGDGVSARPGQNALPDRLDRKQETQQPGGRRGDGPEK